MIVDLFFLNRVSKGTVSENKLGHVKIVSEVIWKMGGNQIIFKSFKKNSDLNGFYIKMMVKSNPLKTNTLGSTEQSDWISCAD